MYSSEDLELFSISEYNERLLTDCRTEKRFQEILFPVPDGGNAEGISIEQFCSRNKVPYNIFYKWYKENTNRMQSSLLELLRCSLSYQKIHVTK